jgi:CheY-specific phosphatase CheX
MMSGSRITREVEEAVRRVTEFVAKSMKTCFEEKNISLKMGAPMVLVGKNVTSFASYPFVGHDTNFLVGKGYGTVKYAILKKAGGKAA